MVFKAFSKMRDNKGSDGPFLSYLVMVSWDAKHFSDRALAPVVGVNGGPRFPLLRFEFPPSV